MTIMSIVELALAIAVLWILLEPVFTGAAKTLAVYKPRVLWLVIVAIVWFAIRHLEVFSPLRGISL